MLKNVAVTIKQSPLKWGRVMQSCRDLHLKSRKVQLDCPTRWSGLCYMLQSIVDIWPGIFRAYQNAAFRDYPVDAFPTDQIILRVTRYLKVLRKIEVAQRHLEGDQYVTLSLVPHYIHSIFQTLQPDDDDVPSLGNLKASLLQSFKKHLNFIFTQNNLALKAAILDTRTCLGLKNLLSNALYEEVWESIAEEMFTCRSCAAMDRDVFVVLCRSVQMVERAC